MQEILILDDDVSFGLMLKTLLEKNRFKVTSVVSPLEAKRLIHERFYEVVFTDMRMPEMDGLEVINVIRQISPRTRVIVMTGYADISTAIKSIKQGAFDYISKPLNPEEVLNIIREAKKPEQKDNRKQERQELSFSYFEGKSRESKSLKEYISKVAPTLLSVLLVGESGTGKEYVARLIHNRSKRENHPFVAVDCGAISKELAASEFFGHIKGSFTGAIADKKGYFETANQGTLFLDEVGNLSLETQMHLLRALQDCIIKPVGSTKGIQVDVRIIAATNENLVKAMEQGRFRKDLYHRLNEFQINIPSLHERKSDIMPFASYFLTQANTYLDKTISGFEKNVEMVFRDYLWPGNLRELKNVVKRAALLAKNEWITIDDIPGELYEKSFETENITRIHNENEPDAIRKALEVADYNKSKAARLLKIDRKTLYNKLKLYDIELP